VTEALLRYTVLCVVVCGAVMDEDAPARPVRCARTLAVRRQPGADLTTAELQQPIARRVLEIEGYASAVCVMDESPLADNLDRCLGSN
jgi:hypothetical protein